MSDKISISFVIPVFKTENYLSDCIESILKNLDSNCNYELIIVDDCSPLGVAKEITEKYSYENVTLKYVRHDVNRSLFQARLTGFKMSTGEYVTTVDSDDLLIDMNWSSLKNLFNKGTDIISFPVYVGKDEHSSKLDTAHFVNHSCYLNDHDQIINLFFKEKQWPVLSKFYKNSFIKRIINNFDEKVYINIAEDFLYSSCFMLAASSYERVCDVGKYFYRISDGSITREPWLDDLSKINKRLDQYETVITELLRMLKCFNQSDEMVAKVRNLWDVNLKWLYAPLLPVIKSSPILYLKLSQIFSKKTLSDNIINESIETISSVASVYPKCNIRIDFKKVTFIVNSLTNGGAERVTSNVANLLANNGYEITVITSKKASKQDYSINESVRILTIPYGESRLNKLIYSLGKSSGHLVVFVDHWIEETFKEILYVKLNGYVVMAQEHNSFWFPFYMNRLDFFNKRLYAYKCLDLLTCLSELDCKLWKQSGVQNVCYLPNLMSFRSSSSNIQREDKILFLGRLTKSKGLFFIPDIIEKVVKKLPYVSVDLCGEFSNLNERQLFLSLLREKNIEGNVNLRGFVNDIGSSLAKAKLLLLPSFVEGSPMVINEARAYGTPIVMFDNNYIDNANNGTVKVPLGNTDLMADQVINLMQDESKWNDLSQDCLVNLEKWDENSLLLQWNTLFYQLKNNRRDYSECEFNDLENAKQFHRALQYFFDNFYSNAGCLDVIQNDLNRNSSFLKKIKQKIDKRIKKTVISIQKRL